jgi:hypothetical protein
LLGPLRRLAAMMSAMMAAMMAMMAWAFRDVPCFVLGPS